MSVSSLWVLLAKAHPALVHAPIGAVLFLPLALVLALGSKLHKDAWLHTSAFLASLRLLGGLAALGTGLLFARELGGILPGQWLAHPLHPAPSFIAFLKVHQLLALSGLPVGIACWALLVRALRGRATALRVAFALSLLWLGLWGTAGHWGGRMVFRDPPADGALP